MDVYIANFLRQEVIEKEKKTELEAQLKVIKDLELQITKWHAEEHRQKKTIQILTAQREIKAREAAKAQVSYRCPTWNPRNQKLWAILPHLSLWC